jgi:putative addiction module component (TIGR02574 family)
VANRLPDPPPGFDELPVGEQIEYVHALWDRIVAREHEIPMLEEHRAELDRRLAEHDADPDGVRPWSEVQADLRAELAQRRAR